MWKILGLGGVYLAFIVLSFAVDVNNDDLLVYGAEDVEEIDVFAAHAKIMEGDENYYPSANECKQCHPDHYKEWSVSPHGYAQMSPVFNTMQATVFKLTNGTNGDFCIRCHTPVGMNHGEEIFMTNIDRSPTAREGVTCVVCHRVNKNYGKISGRLAIQTGKIEQPIFGPKGIEDFSKKFGSNIEEKMGEGKVFGTILGHNFFTFNDPLFRIILLRAMAWTMDESFDPFKPLVTINLKQ